MSLRRLRSRALRLGASLACLVACGCWFSSAGPPKEPVREIVPADGGRLVTSTELDELTRAFADRYAGLLYSACEELTKDNPDLEQRREAQRLLVDCSSNIYDIASNADSFTRLLDLLVVTNLTSQVWVDDGRAATVFRDRAQPLVDAMQHARKETEALAARVLTAEQLAVMQSLLADWRSDNPEMIRASFVRFSNFAVGRGRSAVSEVLATRGFFAGVEQAGRAVDEVRLLGERAFYMLKRQPTLLRWQIAAARDELLATPAVTSAVADLHRLADEVAQLPTRIAAEREAVLAAVDSRIAEVDAAVARVGTTAGELRSLVESLEPALRALDRLLVTSDAVLARYDAFCRFAVDNHLPPFDVREYTEAAQQVATASRDLNALVQATDALLGSPQWRARVEDLSRSADGRIENAAAESRLLVEDLFRRIYFALGGLFVVLVCYRLVSVLITRTLLTQNGGRTRPPPGREPGSQPDPGG